MPPALDARDRRLVRLPPMHAPDSSRVRRPSEGRLYRPVVPNPFLPMPHLITCKLLIAPHVFKYKSFDSKSELRNKMLMPWFK